MRRPLTISKPAPAFLLLAAFSLTAVSSQQRGSAPEPAVAGEEAVFQRILENRLALTRYRWKLRREVRQSGRLLTVQVEEWVVDENGFFRATPISEDPVLKDGKKKAMVQDVMRLARTYLLPTTLGLKETLAKAMVTPGAGGNDGMTRIQIDSYNQLGDTAVYWVDNVDHRARRLEVDARLWKIKKEKKKKKGGKVRIEAEFAPIEGGANYVARARVVYPKGGLEIQVEFFDFVPKEAAASSS